MQHFESGQTGPGTPEGGISPEKASRWAEIVSENIGGFTIIKQGIELGLPAPVLEAQLQKILANGDNQGDFWYEYKLRKNLQARLGYGEDSDIKDAGIRAYAQAMTLSSAQTAIQLAEELYGAESAEYTAAVQRGKMLDEADVARQAEVGAMLSGEKTTITLTHDATLFSMEENPRFDDDVFWSEIHGNFNPEVAEALLSLTIEEKQTTKVLEFFEQYGYDLDDLETFLPISFE
jgi:hypothetical protein